MSKENPLSSLTTSIEELVETNLSIVKARSVRTKTVLTGLRKLVSSKQYSGSVSVSPADFKKLHDRVDSLVDLMAEDYKRKSEADVALLVELGKISKRVHDLKSKINRKTTKADRDPFTRGP